MIRKKVRDPVRIKRGSTVLVVVDVQEKLYPFISGNDAMAVEIVRLVNFADIIGIPVLHMEQAKLGPTVKPIADALGSRKPAVKETYGGFGCPAFTEALSAHRFDTLLLTGIESHVCVLQTAMEALERGYRVQVVADAVSSRSAYNKEIALARMRAAGAEVTCAESVMFEIMGRAGTEEFRRVLPLLK